MASTEIQRHIGARDTDMSPERFNALAFVVAMAAMGVLAGFFTQLLAEDFRRWSWLIAGVCVAAVIVAGLATLVRRRRSGAPKQGS